jgi:hypothetical protein
MSKCQWALRPTERGYGLTTRGEPYTCGSHAFNDEPGQEYCDKHMQMDRAEKAEAEVERLRSLMRGAFTEGYELGWCDLNDGVYELIPARADELWHKWKAEGREVEG